MGDKDVVAGYQFDKAGCGREQKGSGRYGDKIADPASAQFF
jgi:hypothetical protein